jgi:hypothetical protein
LNSESVPSKNVLVKNCNILLITFGGYFRWLVNASICGDANNIKIGMTTPDNI